MRLKALAEIYTMHSLQCTPLHEVSTRKPVRDGIFGCVGPLRATDDRDSDTYGGAASSAILMIANAARPFLLFLSLFHS